MAAVILLASAFALPLVIMVVGSLGTPGLPPPDGGLDLVPDAPRWSNYRDAASIVPLRTQVLNSLLVVLVAVPVSVLVGSLAGFAMAVGTRAQRRLLVAATLAALFVPAAALWVPRVAMVSWAGLAGHPLSVTFTALIGTSPLFVLLFALAHRRIPSSILDAARSEGLSALRTWWSVAVPLTRPTSYAVAVLSLVAHWGNAVEPLLLLTREERQTAALGIRALSSLEPTLYPIFLAGAVVVTVPAIAAFLLTQRAFFASATQWRTRGHR